MKEIIKNFEPRRAMSSMATWAFGILSAIVWWRLNFLPLKYLWWVLIYLAILFLILFLIIFTIRIFKYPKEVLNDLKHPIVSNFFAGIFISSAVITTWIINVLTPLHRMPFALQFSQIFYIFALIFWILIPVLVPFFLTISEETKSKHAVGIRFLPPVWVFVLVFAWNFLASKWVWTNRLPFVNLFLLGMAFIVYFMVQVMFYSRIKFHELPKPEVAPSFVIWLAPIWVSIVAMSSLFLMVKKTWVFWRDLEVLHTIVSMFSGLMMWFWFRRFLVAWLIIIYYIIKKWFPYTLWRWALVFPTSAFGIWLHFVVLNLKCQFLCPVIFFVRILAWILRTVVFTKTLKNIFNWKAFVRPDIVK